MNPRLAAWRFQQQGLGGSATSWPPGRVLSSTGWARSIGGAAPYLILWARSGASRESVDQAAADASIHELPAARGCTYVVPRDDYALALQASGPPAEAGILQRHFGVSAEELEALGEAVLVALETGPRDPKELRAELGDRVRNLGEEGKKKGITTTLPPVLGRLQTQGRIRRISANGRMDTQTYRYALWRPSPLEGAAMSPDEVDRELARRYFGWIGPCPIEDFAAFAGISGRRAKAAVAADGFDQVAEGVMLAEQRSAYDAFEPDPEPCVRFLSSLDGLLLLRRGLADVVADEDLGHEAMGEKQLRRLGDLRDLESHAIVDRGRLIGLWEFDAASGEVVYRTFSDPTEAVREQASTTSCFIREELGDARAYSLDTPASRAPRVAWLRENGHAAR